MQIDVSWVSLTVCLIISLLPVTSSHSDLFQAGQGHFKFASNVTSGMSRQVILNVLSVEQDEGVGARVRRSVGRSELQNLDPFLMLDEFKVASPAGFPDHPHRGFETVTYMLSGSFRHEDFCGHKGVISAGDLQWMTAGRGVVHCEMPHGEQEGHGLQLWVNLAAKDKMVEPAYQELLDKNIPRSSKDGVTVKVIAGESYNGIKCGRKFKAGFWHPSFNKINEFGHGYIASGGNFHLVPRDGFQGADCRCSRLESGILYTVVRFFTASDGGKDVMTNIQRRGKFMKWDRDRSVVSNRLGVQIDHQFHGRSIHEGERLVLADVECAGLIEVNKESNGLQDIFLGFFCEGSASRTCEISAQCLVTAFKKLYKYTYTYRVLYCSRCLVLSTVTGGRDGLPHHTLVLGGEGDRIDIENKGSETCHFVLIGGKPLNEPIVQHGPFVMNTEEEIRQAQADYFHDTNGFEGARSWNSFVADEDLITH
ncbi:uncharacterized protein LOC124287291 [Haliotis rubra]|uniref:uncharacterized protein LOC124287291 n=1 Tax=Haliotis rubra TaxID=36100 RepID=UPI001EE5F07A|nr:uncharacterized protein LOC124287291 [Haliotis rubra]